MDAFRAALRAAMQLMEGEQQPGRADLDADTPAESVSFRGNEEQVSESLINEKDVIASLLKATSAHKTPIRSRGRQPARVSAAAVAAQPEEQQPIQQVQVDQDNTAMDAEPDPEEQEQLAEEQGEEESVQGSDAPRPGMAHIKREYVLPKLPYNPFTDKKTRGQNKHRPAPMRETVKLCLAMMRTGECGFGDKCKYVHDKEEYLKSKLPDIEGQCPFWRRQGGHCNYGLTCRFSSSHTPMTEEEIAREKVRDDLQEEETNTFNNKMRVTLRKFKYPFPRSETYLKELAKADQDPAVRAAMEEKFVGAIADKERRQIDWQDKLYLAPLTTVGNLPFRRLCKRLGADITCGEMAMARNLLEGQKSEWALLRRHESEDVFGVQICGHHPRLVTKCVELLNNETDVDFIDLNCGCPIDLVFKQGAGSALLGKKRRFGDIVRGMNMVSDIPITIKIRGGVSDNNWTSHTMMPHFKEWGASLVTIHGRSRQQRYSRSADWGYIRKCVEAAHGLPVIGNGDILSFEEAVAHQEATGVAGLMLARGALIKPWLFTEIKEKRHWDISATERFEYIKEFADYGLQHWGSDTQGVEVTRRFLLEWLSFTCRYIPVGILERVPQRINERPPRFVGRNDLETLLSSYNSEDWVKISEMVLGPPPPGYNFIPKHKASSYDSTEQGEG
eukprot:m.42220 g.42220  ORF g.42220 m.42220 type:complete len:673 (-) comp11903_c0_seq2:587-2605(-)